MRIGQSRLGPQIVARWITGGDAMAGRRLSTERFPSAQALGYDVQSLWDSRDTKQSGASCGGRCCAKDFLEILNGNTE